MTTPVFRTFPATDAEREAIRLIGDTPFVANVTIQACALAAPRSILAGPGVRFDQQLAAPDAAAAAARSGRDRDRRSAPLFGDGDARRLLAVLCVIAGLAIVAIAAAAVRAS
ncbi:hypothetical protein [Microbaculum marinisediminis]|uniref:Uncharacterized protein n=1 Tax=Microbaculum marinisediminis TaxID=2931392 RepID=A0AAW5QWE2_9HYPH|nr:hypothetical protein [Microbaculum sp. A6E488]MCT8970610.1 hypothetical protein [Microbaculum sp. A6E488]